MDRKINKLFLKPTIKKFVQINRCKEGEGRFVHDVCPLPIPYQGKGTEFLYNLFWPDENMENVQIRRLGTSNSSLMTLAEEMRRSRTISTRPSALESVLEGGVAQSMHTLEILEQEQVITEHRRDTEDAITQMPIGEPVVPSSTPRKRKLITLAEDDDKLPREGRDSKQPRAIKVPTIEIPTSSRQSPESSQIVSSQDVAHIAPEQLLPSTTVPPVKTAILGSDYKLRQQRIIDKVVSWTSSQGILTIEDVCEKPINRINIAKAFSDLLTLARYGFLILRSEEDSTELRSIEKGPKLLTDQ